MDRPPGHHQQDLGRLGCFLSSGIGTRTGHLFSCFPGIPPKHFMENWGEADRLPVCLEKHIYNQILTFKATAGTSAAPPGLEKQLKRLLKTKAQCNYDVPILGKHVCSKGKLTYHFVFHAFAPSIVSHYTIWRELYVVVIQTWCATGICLNRKY